MGITVERVGKGGGEAYQRFVLSCSRAVVQQTWEWSEMICEAGPDEPVFFLARDEVNRPVGAMPAFYFEGPLGSLLLSNPEAGGYGGIVVENSVRSPDVHRALQQSFLEEARQRGCALASVTTPPFFGALDMYSRDDPPDYTKENFYQFLDLRKPFLQCLTSKKRGNLKGECRIAQNHGLTILYDHGGTVVDKLYQVHCKRCDELGIATLPRPFLEGIRTHICERGMGFFAHILKKDRVVAGGLFVGLNRVMDVFMLCVDSEFFPLNPVVYLMFHVIEHCSKTGYWFLNWQSSPSRESGVYAFKKRWGSEEHHHYYLTWKTGDITKILNASPETLVTHYPRRYVIPYEALNRVSEGRK